MTAADSNRRPLPPLVHQTLTVRARCPFNHEWLTTVDRSYRDYGRRRPNVTTTIALGDCPHCGRAHVSYTDLRHG